MKIPLHYPGKLGTYDELLLKARSLLHRVVQLSQSTHPPVADSLPCAVHLRHVSLNLGSILCTNQRRELAAGAVEGSLVRLDGLQLLTDTLETF